MPNLTWLTRRSLDSEQRAAGRVLWVGSAMILAITVILLVLLARVVQLESSPPPRIAALENEAASHVAIEARRGALLDRRGRIIADTKITHLLYVDPKLIENHNTFAEDVGYRFGIDPVHISKILWSHPKSQYIVLDRRLTAKQYKLYQSLHLPGLYTKAIPVREYPQGKLAGQLIGFVGRNGKGLAGLEAKFQKQLAAHPGQYTFLRDARRRGMWPKLGSYQPAVEGRDVRLSLDMTIQAIAQHQLDKAVKKFHAKAGQLIVIRPTTGEILAMANDPTFNPNDFAKAKPADRRNRCVTDAFEPGSIFKPMVWSSLTELGAAKPHEIINCTSTGVFYTKFGRRLRDAEPNGKITWEQVLIHSSNIGMAKVSLRVKISTLYHIVKDFGFGQVTGSGLPGEIPGIVNPEKRWNKYSQTSIPMGQEIAVTPLQMMRAYCVFANGGLLIRPRIVAINPLDPRPIVEDRVISRKIALLTRRVMRRVVTQGTGRHARSKLYKIFGKTGTAQLPNHIQGGYYQHKYVASFIGGAPLNDPRLLVGCFIKQPDPKYGHYGGTVSAPVVKAVLDQALTYLGVPHRKDKTTDNTSLALAHN